MMLSGGAPQGNTPAAAAASSAVAASGFLREEDVQPAGLKLDSLREMPLTRSLGIQALATIQNQFITAGWEDDTPLAVGVFRHAPAPAGRFTFVYATADGISLLPYGVTLPPAVLPLSRIDGVDGVAAKELAGKKNLREKLEKLVPKHYGKCETILDTNSLSSDQCREIITAGDAFPVSVTRAQLARVLPEDAQMEIVGARAQWNFPDIFVDNLEDSRQAMIDSRWDSVRIERCPTMTVAWMIAESRQCFLRGYHEEAGYSIGEVVHGEIKDELTV
jgi:hypothetical protein